jgi:hypothetical protein
VADDDPVRPRLVDGVELVLRLARVTGERSRRRGERGEREDQQGKAAAHTP